ncbi:CDP-archaeol synthase [Nitrincola sp. MINF-07-Sa-05]|uniref:CDP-archaeol synthase n=1 Tax=Nitrincola salilacus TaxID=3400273 RepID=UPI003917C6F6
MFKQRVITGLLIGPAVLAAVWWFPISWFALLIGAATLYGAWEWSNFCRYGLRERVVFVVLIALLLGVVYGFLNEALVSTVTLMAVLFWLAALIMVLRYPSSSFWSNQANKMLIGIAVLVPAWLAMTAIKAWTHGEFLILLLLALVWGADIGAYAAGKTLGKRKLLPEVSPGKTREGCVGGLLVCVLVGVAYSMLRELPLTATVYFVLLSLITGMASVLGDLFESMLKRERGIKDSGRLLPGHGGVLDRIDSLTAAAPVFLAGLYMAPQI